MLYKRLTSQTNVITASALKELLKNGVDIERAVDDAIQKELFKNSRLSSNFSYKQLNGLQIINRRVILHYLRQLLKIDLSIAPFTIYGLEGDVFATINVSTSRGNRKVRIGGRIDRLDEVTAEDGQRILRVVDYKTGRVNPEDLDFGKTGDIPQIGLQLYLYKRLLSPDYPGADITGAIYQPAAIIAGEGVIAHSLDQEFCSRMDSGLDSVLDEICDLSVPWQRTDKRDKCAMCDFRAICGR
jgi:ATP-dependent helicase/DNAse subunit B